MVFIVHAKILTKKADILTNKHIFTTFFRKNGFNGKINRGRHCYIENCISTRSTIKVFMRVSLKLRFRPDFWQKHEKYHIFSHFLVY